MSAEAVVVIGRILAHELALPAGQIMLTNERFNIPATNGLYIALSYVSGKPIGNVNYATSDGTGPIDGMTEHQSVTMLYLIQIDAMSFDASARVRKEEIYLALKSIFSEQQQEINGMQIATLPSQFNDVSSLEETKYLNRYTTTISVTALITKDKAGTDYYNEFLTPEVTPNV